MPATTKKDMLETKKDMPATTKKDMLEKCKTKLERTPETEQLYQIIARAERWLQTHTWRNPIIKWETQKWGEVPADFGRK